ncbi:hypothetical protein JOM56_000718 [Amanita muscaria]
MPYYGPQEDNQTIILERTFLVNIFVSGVGYGAQLIIYIVCMRHLWRERKRRVMVFLLCFITLLLSLSSLGVATDTWTAEDMYINNRNYPGGPWMYFVLAWNLPENAIYNIILFLSIFISDLLMLWRCWVIWNSSVSRPLTCVVLFSPVLMLVASFASPNSTDMLTSVTGIMWCLRTTVADRSPYMKLPILLGTAYYGTSFSTNILVTFFIILRLALHRRATLQTLPVAYAEQYLSIAAIFVESAALYSVVAVASIICYALASPITQVIIPLVSPCQQISGYLIIIRLAQGQAWTPNMLGTTTGTTMQLSTLQFPAITATRSSRFGSGSDENESP